MHKYLFQAKKLFLFWKPLLWLLLICYGLFLPASELPKKPFLSIPHFDKVVHFSLFFIFCILLFRPLKQLQLKQYYWAPLISITLGGLLELIQHNIASSRSSNFYDFLANLSGILIATLFYQLLVSDKKWEKFF